MTAALTTKPRWPGTALRDEKGNIPFRRGKCIRMTRWGTPTPEGRRPTGPVKMQWIELRPGEEIVEYGSTPTKMKFLEGPGLIMGCREGSKVRIHYRVMEGAGFWAGELYEW